jgi:hypothetical protein
VGEDTVTAVAVEPGVVLSGPMSAALEFLCWGGGRSPLEPLAAYVAARNVCPLGDAGDALAALIDLGYVRVTRAGARDPLFHLTDIGRDLACQPTDEQEDTMTDTTDLTEVKPDPKPEKAPAKKRTPSRKTAEAKVVAAKDEAAGQAPPVEDVTGKPNEAVASIDAAALASQFQDAVQIAVGEIDATEKQAYVRLNHDGKLVCYVRQTKKGLLIQLEARVASDAGIAAAVDVIQKAFATA